jgi:DNA polymerase
MQVIASCVRGAITAAPGRELCCMDYSQIEARLVAWFAGQIDVLKVFESGQDIYIHAAAQIFGIPREAVTKQQRFFGKIAVLALGYQGGAGAFASMAAQFGVEVEASLADKIKNDWRAANDKTVQLWYDLERCMINAISNPGKAFGLANGLLKFKVIGRWLYMLLPSGKRIAYFDPGLDADGKPTYMGIDTYTRQWGRVTTYGGRILQNACEGAARDLVAEAMLRLEAADYNPIGSVHDEAITEPLAQHGSLEEAMKIFVETPAWATGLPVAADGWRGKRYRK